MSNFGAIKHAMTKNRQIEHKIKLITSKINNINNIINNIMNNIILMILITLKLKCGVRAATCFGAFFAEWPTLI